MITALVTAGSALSAFALLVTRHRFALMALLAAVLVLQNLVAMLALRTGVIPIAQGEAFLIGKEVMALAALLVAVGALAARAVSSGLVRLGSTERWMLAYFIVVVFAFLTSNATSLTANLAGVRSLVILPALFLLGLWLGASPLDARRMQRLLVWLGVALALFGLVEAYLLPDSFWLAIGHEEYYLMKRGRPIQDALYGNMRYWLNGTPIRRVASLTGDPLISSYPLAFALWLLGASVIVRRRLRISLMVVAVVLAAALLLTLSRGAFVTLFVALGLALAARRSPRAFTAVTLAAFLGAIVVALAFGAQILSFTTGAGHLDQLRAGLLGAIRHPLGIGTGTAGAAAAAIVLASGAGTRIAADSYVGSLALQLGLAGLVLFLVTMLSMSHELYRYASARVTALPRWWHLATATFLAGLLVVSTVNEAGYGYVAVGLVFLWAGVLTAVERRQRHLAPPPADPLPAQVLPDSRTAEPAQVGAGEDPS